MHSNGLNRIVIVDGYATGGDLLHALLDRNVECLHLQSTRHPPPPFSSTFDPTPYDGDLGFAGDVSAAIQLLSDLSPHAVVAGSEGGVRLAELVADGLVLPTNRFEKLVGRRYAHSTLTAVRQNRARATDGAFSARFGRPQFIVNTVSQAGRHFITDAWHVLFPTGGVAADLEGFQLLDPARATSDELMGYTLRVLDDLGIENGAAHTQLEWTPRGPVLMGTAACLAGIATHRESYRAVGVESQADVFARVLAGTDAEREALFKGHHYRLTHHLTKLLFRLRGSARVRSVSGLARLRTLPSFHAHHRPLSLGDQITRASAWAAPGGVVYLVHDDLGQIGADSTQFRLWESRGELYGLATVGEADAQP